MPMTWLRSWRERRKRMRWFADEFLPELMAAAPGRSLAAHAVAESTALVAPAESARSLYKLDELLRRLPESERERLKTLFTPLP